MLETLITTADQAAEEVAEIVTEAANPNYVEMNSTYVGSVVISGLVIVFAALVLLIVFVFLFGKVFDAINASADKKAKEAAKKAVRNVVPKAEPVKAEPAKQTAPVIEDGISDEVVAVIAAAVAAMSAETGRTFALKSVKRSGSSRRGAWGNAGAAESTRSF